MVESLMERLDNVEEKSELTTNTRSFLMTLRDQHFGDANNQPKSLPLSLFDDYNNTVLGEIMEEIRTTCAQLEGRYDRILVKINETRQDADPRTVTFI